MKRNACFVFLFMALSLVAIQAQATKPEPQYQWNGRDEGCNMQGSDCLCIPLDTSWSVVRNISDTGCSGPSDPNDLCQRNDDDHTDLVSLGFTFNLYGNSYNNVFINNNGNLSFDGGYCTFTSTGFPVSGYPMVAPFWADVDTRGPLSGIVYMKRGPGWFAVTWDHVGYYGAHDDKLNTFQVIISDGTFAPIGLGNNVGFCYGNMDWTTGDASGGSGGYGGSPATVGVNNGNGVDYFLIGQFDHPGTDYDGPGGNVDGVDYLDCRRFTFAVGAADNIPPVGINFPPDNRICIAAGEVLHLTVGFIGPEADQVVHTVVNSFGLANFSYTSTDGNPSNVDIVFAPDAGQIGDHTIHLTATDNYNPPGVTETDLILCVEAPSPTQRTTWGRVKSSYR
jgi:hypothetical protein